jgi:alpha-tubulin suppressor-like RCC1 family protein
MLRAVLPVLIVSLALTGATLSAEPPAPGGPAVAPMVVLSWGYNSQGQLGDGNRGVDRDTAGAVKDAAGTGVLKNIVAISSGKAFALALADDGTVWAWGDNNEGQLGNDAMPNDSPLPVQVLDEDGDAPLDHVVAIASGSYHSFALRDDGTLWAWGAAEDGRLGDGQTTTDQGTPVQVKDEAGTGFITGVTAVAAGFDHSVVTAAGGAVYAFGNDDYGQLGDDLPLAASALPVRVKDAAGTGFLTGAKGVAASAYTSFATTPDGQAWAWGYSGEGQAGDGSTDQRNLPVKVKGSGGTGLLSNVRQISAGTYHILAVGNDGSALSWGYNSEGQLGDGNIGDDRYVPGPVVTASGPLTGISDIAGGYYHALAARSDGTAWAWGYDDSGQLGNGAGSASRDEAGQVQGFGAPLTSVAEVAAGVDGYSSFALARTATAALTSPATARSRTIALNFRGQSVFGVDGYFVGESPVPPPVNSDDWLSTPPVAYTIQSPGDGLKSPLRVRPGHPGLCQPRSHEAGPDRYAGAHRLPRPARIRRRQADETQADGRRRGRHHRVFREREPDTPRP